MGSISEPNSIEGTVINDLEEHSTNFIVKKQNEIPKCRIFYLLQLVKQMWNLFKGRVT